MAKAEDLDFREEYKRGRFYDELLPYFPLDGRGMVQLPGVSGSFSMHGTDAFDLHHIWGGRMGRWDKVWNVVMVCRTVHEWVERYKTDGRVIAMRRKLDKGEYDQADATECLGFNPIGRLHGLTCAHDFAEAIRQEIMREFY